MAKKVYKVTEDQVVSLINKKKDESSVNETKKRYQITEDQLKKIFGELGNKETDETNS